MKNEADANMEADNKRAERVKRLNNAEQLIYQTENNIKEYEEKLTDEEKQSIRESLDNLKAVYNVADNEKDLTAIEAAAENLSKIWYTIAAKFYKQDSSINFADFMQGMHK